MSHMIARRTGPAWPHSPRCAGESMHRKLAWPVFPPHPSQRGQTVFISDGDTGRCLIKQSEDDRRASSTLDTQINMKLAVALVLTLVGVAVAYPYPGEGSQFTNEAIRQAQNTYLIPKGSSIQKVQEAVEVGAFEHIPGDQRINLFEILGDQVPPEVVSNLQSQVDQVGKN